MMKELISQKFQHWFKTIIMPLFTFSSLNSSIDPDLASKKGLGNAQTARICPKKVEKLKNQSMRSHILFWRVIGNLWE